VEGGDTLLTGAWKCAKGSAKLSRRGGGGSEWAEASREKPEVREKAIPGRMFHEGGGKSAPRPKELVAAQRFLNSWKGLPRGGKDPQLLAKRKYERNHRKKKGQSGNEAPLGGKEKSLRLVSRVFREEGLPAEWAPKLFGGGPEAAGSRGNRKIVMARKSKQRGCAEAGPSGESDLRGDRSTRSGGIVWPLEGGQRRGGA